MHRRSLRRGIALVLLVVVAAGGTWAGYRALDQRRRSRDLDAAKALIARGEIAPARDLLAASARSWPDHGEILYLLGASEQALGHRDEANRAFAAVPEGSSFHGPAALLRARLALERDRLADAETSLREALKTPGKTSAEAYDYWLYLLKVQGRVDEASALVRAAWSRLPDRVDTLRQLWRLDKETYLLVEEQRRVLEQAARSAPDDDRVWLGQARLFVRLGRFADAASLLERCLRRRPEDLAVLRARLDAGLASLDESLVLDALRRLPDKQLDPAEVASIRAWISARHGDPNGERAALAQRIAFAPGDFEALGRLASLELQAGDRDDAARHRQRKADLDQIRARYGQRLFEPDPARDAQDLARWAESLGRWFDARAWWGIAAGGPSSSDPDARAALARIEAAEVRARSGPTLDMLLAQVGPDTIPNRPSRLTGPPPATPAFNDDANASGLRFTYDPGATPSRQMPEAMGSGVGLLDYDGDGWIDVYCTGGGAFPPAQGTKLDGDRLFRNRGNGTFEDRTEASGIAGFPRGYGHGVSVGDIDNDGRPDLFVTRWRSYALYRNRGDGTFEDITERAGLSGDRDWPTSSAFADLDNDGDLDLYVCHYVVWDAASPPTCPDPQKGGKLFVCPPLVSRASPDRLYRNDGGRFVDVTQEAGIVDTEGRGLGVVACDFDNDGRVDLFVANDMSAKYLWKNLGNLRFKDVGAEVGVAASATGGYQASMGIACGDLDGDGRPDLAVTNYYGESTSLHENFGGGIFRDATASRGLAVPSRWRLGFGASFLDFDNNGYLDLATANGHVDDYRPDIAYAMPTQLFRGQGARPMVDVTDQSPALLVPKVARGMAEGDLDNDGRRDLVITSIDGPLAYLHNRTAGGRSITVQLQGTTSNRDAVGARVVITAGGRLQSRWRIGGGSYQSSGDPRLHFGLGTADRVDAVEIHWPSGRVDRHGPFFVDRGYLFREGDPTSRPLPVGSPRPAEGPEKSKASRVGPLPSGLLGE